MHNKPVGWSNGGGRGEKVKAQVLIEEKKC